MHHANAPQGNVGISNVELIESSTSFGYDMAG
jgi:hypothetical protein